MATPASQDKTPFLKTADTRTQDGKPASAFASQDKPSSLYQPRPASAFGQKTPASGASLRPSAFGTGQPSAFGAGQGSAFGTGQPPAFGQNRPSPFGAPKVPASGQKPAAPAAKPFTSLRSQVNAPSAISRFTRQEAAQQAPAFGQRAGQTPGDAAPRPGLRTPAAPSSPFRKDLSISNEEFTLLRDFIYQQCGIFIAENRKYLVENRLSNRLKELNLKSYNEYYNYLRFDASRSKELTKLFEVVTTNETSFFRNPPQLEVFQKVVLAQAIEQARKTGQKRIRIWSAGCSTGEEPYTLAIILQETLRGEIANWDIKITANDLSEAVLAAARQGIYNDYALRTTPKELTAKYFKKEGSVYRIDPELKRFVSFGQINLSNKDQLKRVEKSQIVFCRNVIIYFDDEMKRKVINAFYDNLLPSGVLIIGHSESLHNISRAFQLEHHKGTILYRKTN